jgi:hypothetical protein
VDEAQVQNKSGPLRGNPMVDWVASQSVRPDLTFNLTTFMSHIGVNE